MCRYQFFLQLKLDILSGRLPCEFDTCVELAAYVVQCMCSTQWHLSDLSLQTPLCFYLSVSVSAIIITIIIMIKSVQRDANTARWL